MNDRMQAAFCGGVTACLLAWGCSNPSSSTPPPAVCSADQGGAPSARSLASSNAAFAVDFYGPAASLAGAGTNLILSPYAVSATLTMVEGGAAGETATQVQKVLHMTGTAADLAPAYATLACEDETDGAAAGDQLSLANAVWGQKGKDFKASYLSLLSGGYDAPLQTVDFEGNASGALTDINEWVSTETQSQIASLLQPGDIDAKTRLVLIDAVYFKGAWETSFDPNRTSQRPFTLANGTQVLVSTMDGTVEFGTGFVNGLTIYELPYAGGALALDVLLPDASLSAFEASLTLTSLNAALASVGSPSSAELLLPKFSFKTRLSLEPVLAGMGMPDLFDPEKADLSGMDGARDLSVARVVQQAMIEVDEQGTVAAAATAVDTCDCSAVIEPASVNRPFLFLIRDTKNGSTLFMGRVLDPRSGG